MSELSFHVESAEPVMHSVSPLLLFKLHIRQTVGHGELVPIHTAVLRCQIRLEPAKRHYGGNERESLRDLFDTPNRWSQTLRSLLWTHTTLVLPPFTESVTVDLPVPCTYDFNVATTKYFYALEEGEVPLKLLFSGTVFYQDHEAGLQVAQIPWDRETTFRLPVQVWRAMMEHYYPETAWLNLRRDAFNRLYQYKTRHGLPTWEQTLETLLPEESGRP